MRTLARSIVIISLLSFAACKKNRVCECKNANNTYQAGEIDATKHKAKKHCESLSSTNTECYLK